MSSLHPARRSAERFNSLLDNERESTSDVRHAHLLGLVNSLQTLPRVDARPAFVSDLRGQLMVAAETELVPSDAANALRLADRLTVPTRRTPRERRIAAAIGGFALVGATTSMAVAAQGALPGDVLYPLKRAIENAEAGFSVSDGAKGNTILANASGRLDEVSALARQSDVDAEAVTTTLNEFAQQATQASELLLADYQVTGSESSINELRDFTAASIQELAALEAIIPTGAEAALLEAAHTLFEIDSVAGNLCPLCESPGIVEIPVPLLASGDIAMDQAQVAAAAAADAKQSGKKPAGGSSVLPTEATAPAIDNEPVTVPGAGPGTGPSGGKGGKGDNQPQNPNLPGNPSLPTSLPSVKVPPVGEIASGLGDVVDGISGNKG